ncbi:MAG: AAA family ATPase [Sphingobacteriia bacterium]|nr:AAA family ATPase [Sphingobacteriia bacterium]
MERLYEIFDLKLRHIPEEFSRSLLSNINWNHRLISLLGARGTGKTTLVLQHIKRNFQTPGKEVLYADVNHIFFNTSTLIDLADQFYKKGGKYLFLDEIHKYPNWSVELKQIYDTYTDLHVVITGSSILEIEKGEADMSRRAVKRFLPGMSFREFLELDQGIHFNPITFEDILNHHQEIANEIAARIRPLKYFNDYLQYGYYPYFIEGKEVYFEKLLSTINLILETDIPVAEKIDFYTIIKIKKLLSIIATSVPFKPNTEKLSAITKVSRPTLIKLFNLLQRAQLILMLQSSTKGIQKMAKPEKLYLNNPNLMYALAPANADKGTLRETFFLNQLQDNHKVELPRAGDFIVDDTYTFEVGGKNKTPRQLSGIQNAFVVADDIETGFEHKIPLWLIGLLY